MANIADEAAKAACAPPGEKGRNAATPAQIPAPGWKEIAFRTWMESSKDNVSLVAAGVAFYGWLVAAARRGREVAGASLLATAVGLSLLNRDD